MMINQTFFLLVNLSLFMVYSFILTTSQARIKIVTLKDLKYVCH